tara:strand:+ start:287 stop:439 length:153 start_codon:yes stop_codon:yes gene_type:complete
MAVLVLNNSIKNRRAGDKKSVREIIYPVSEAITFAKGCESRYSLKNDIIF